MKIVSDQTLQWWQQKNSREQTLLILLATILGFAAIYVLVVAPILHDYRDAKQAYATINQDYRWLQDQSGVLDRLRSEAGGTLSVSKPPQFVQQQIIDELGKINIKNTTQIIKNGEEELVQIEIERVVGTKFMRWLDSLSRGGKKVVEVELESRSGLLFGAVVVSG